MSKFSAVHETKLRRLKRTRARLQGTAERPRLVSYISNRHVSAQLIDDVSRRTLAGATSSGQKLAPSLTTRAEWVGGEIAKAAKAAKIEAVIFDRGSRRYHGRIKALAEAAKAGGLKF